MLNHELEFVTLSVIFVDLYYLPVASVNAILACCASNGVFTSILLFY